MSFFSGVEKARAAGDRLYFRPGRYTCEVLEAKQGESPKDGTAFFNVEYRILAAAEGSENRAGDIVNHHIRKKGTKEEVARQLGEIKSCVAAIMGIGPDQVDMKGCEVFVGVGQPGIGRRVEVHARNKVTKAGKDFTIVSYPTKYEVATGAVESAA